ncbi:MAG TPA: hypothetical protein VEH27_12340 [Methylomirabilota bacterium]|nr:hypothetical protein [Methylomirabilota bacterium]
MSRRVIAALLVLALFALHQDFWWWKTARPLLLGTLPPALSYHALYCVLASLLMWALVRLVWPRHIDELERDQNKRP